MYHFYNQKQPPTLDVLANVKPIERLFYFASMEVEQEDEVERLGADAF